MTRVAAKIARLGCIALVCLAACADHQRTGPVGVGARVEPRLSRGLFLAAIDHLASDATGRLIVDPRPLKPDANLDRIGAADIATDDGATAEFRRPHRTRARAGPHRRGRRRPVHVLRRGFPARPHGPARAGQHPPPPRGMSSAPNLYQRDLRPSRAGGRGSAGRLEAEGGGDDQVVVLRVGPASPSGREWRVGYGGGKTVVRDHVLTICR